MTFSKLIKGTISNNGKYSKRLHKVSGMIMHHAADTNFEVVKQMMGANYDVHQLSANYLINNNGDIWGCVPEEYRAFTSADPDWDGRSITFECINETGAPDWKISAKAQEAIAQLLADVAQRYNFTPKRPPVGNRRAGNVFGHGELWKYFRASYATACPGGLPVTRITKRALAIIKAASAPPKPRATSGTYAPKGGQLILRGLTARVLKISDSGKVTIANGMPVQGVATVTFTGRKGARVRLGLEVATYEGTKRTDRKLVRKVEGIIPASGKLELKVAKTVAMNSKQRLRINAKALVWKSIRVRKIVWSSKKA